MAVRPVSILSDRASIFQAVVPRRTNRPFTEEVPRLLRARGLSIRGLAREAGVTDAHLSRVLRGVAYKRPSAELARSVALALDLPEDYFPEFREGFVIDRLKRDPRARDQFYDRLRRRLKT